MRLVSLKQGTKQWREWRGKGLGASDAPVFMGESPWQTPFELWLTKTGLAERTPPNEFALAAMRRGTELEPKARKKLEAQLGMTFEDCAAEHDDYPFLRASYDGRNDQNQCIIEIKCPGKEAHSKALKGKVPDYYIPQIQQQLMISGDTVCYYGSWDGDDKSDVVVIKVLPDLEYQGKLLQTAKDFWMRVQERILPEISEKDVTKLLNQQASLTEQLSKLTEVLKLMNGVK